MRQRSGFVALLNFRMRELVRPNRMAAKPFGTFLDLAEGRMGDRYAAVDCGNQQRGKFFRLAHFFAPMLISLVCRPLL